jgi:hypothetical protein
VPLPLLWTLHWSNLTELLLIMQNVQPSKLIRLTIQQFMRICIISIQHTHQHYHSRFLGVITTTILAKTQVLRTQTHSAFRDTPLQESGLLKPLSPRCGITCLNMSNPPLMERAMASHITLLHSFSTSQPCDVS